MSKLAGLVSEALGPAKKEEEEKDEVIELPGNTYAPHSKRKPEMPIIAKRDWAWNVDSFFYQLPKETEKRAIFCAVEMTSRKAFALPYQLNDKTTATAKAGQAVANLKALRAKYPINLIQSDQGGEFKNPAVAAWAKAQTPPIEIYFTQAGVKPEVAMVESFNGNLRQILDMYSAAKTKRKAGYEDFNDFIRKSIESYNNAKSDILNASPASVDESKMGYIRLVLANRGDDYLKKLDSIQPGDTIRIWDAADPRLDTEKKLKDFNFAHKGRHKWIDDHLFEVQDLSGYKVVVKDFDGGHVYARRISPRDIQVVPKPEKAPEPDKEVKAAAVARKEARAQAGKGVRATKIYAVKVGRVPGLYINYDEAAAQIKGFKGGKLQSFTDEAAAKAWTET